MINDLIDELIAYALENKLITKDDEIYTINRLLELFELDGYKQRGKAPSSRRLSLILDDMLRYAAENGLIKEDTTSRRDLFDTKIMAILTPPPSAVRAIWRAHLAKSPREATDWYYGFCQATNYIRTDRIEKDEKWTAPTDFGELDITINLSKPEKDPRDIAKAGAAKASGYPSCLLCRENEGYAGTLTHPARGNHRIIPITLCDESYYLQYSPYVYYNEHCIIFNKNHIPMKIDRSAFAKLLDFVRQFPHYTAGSNADLPIVGGSILSHDHFQGGGYEFPMVRAPYETEFTIPGFENIHAGIIRWQLSTIRLQGRDTAELVRCATHILDKWRAYTDEDAFIFAQTDGTPHNTITPIARRRGELFELDLVLRNNITTDEHPMGVYHPHSEYHHIKKENIGLIEVMGLAILPARLKKEMARLEELILSGGDLKADPLTASHADWAAGWTSRRSVNPENIHKIVQEEIGTVFSKVLENAGVYKATDEGRAAFMRFVKGL